MNSPWYELDKWIQSRYNKCISNNTDRHHTFTDFPLDVVNILVILLHIVFGWLSALKCFINIRLRINLENLLKYFTTLFFCKSVAEPVLLVDSISAVEFIYLEDLL